MRPLNLVIASANSLLLDGLRSLSALGDFKIVGEANTSSQTLELVQQHRPDALVVDDRLAGSGMIESYRISCPTLRVVLLEGPTELIAAPHLIDALVQRTSSMGALASTVASLFPGDGERVVGLR